MVQGVFHPTESTSPCAAVCVKVGKSRLLADLPVGHRGDTRCAMKKILLVDDDIELTGMLARYLRREQFEVDLAHYG